MNIRGQAIDKTFLSLENAEDRGFIHRDYIAHCLRWSHVIKKLNERRAWEKAIILDVGCGREIPLAMTMYSSKFRPKRYIGVDAGPIPNERIAQLNNFPSEFYENSDILSVTTGDLGIMRKADDGEMVRGVTHITCFEMLEHIEPAHCVKALQHLRALSSHDTIAWFSTPCWDEINTAGNHVNEMKYEALGATLEACGWGILNVYGTFASLKDYEHILIQNPAMAEIFEKLRSYYDTNFLSTIFAPMYPERSRNALWECVPLSAPRPLAERRFPNILKVKTPWSSSDKWREMSPEVEPHSEAILH